MKARYDDLVKGAGGNREYHLHHILVSDEQQAKDLIAKIKAGAKFEDLAKQYSKDPGSGKNGGDLDWSDPKAYVPEFAAAAQKLQKGQMTDTPVKTQFGWHIIRVDDIRDIAPPPLEQVKQQIAQQLVQQKLQAFEEGLRQRQRSSNAGTRHTRSKSRSSERFLLPAHTACGRVTMRFACSPAVKSWNRLTVFTR